MRRGLSAWLLLAGLMLGLSAASAAAMPPPNDDFAGRQVLEGALPLEVTASNVGATREEREYLPGLSPAGHSVWFEWEAEEDGWVTIGTCDDDFPTIVAIFTGTAVDALTKVTEGNGSEGPDCPYSGRQFSIEAASGTKYEIAVDGNNFHMPESPMPVTEGSIELRIEKTPLPPNDDFESAIDLTGSISEEPDGARFFYAGTQGFTWTATTQAGEPESGASGASVWYSFTAPEEADYRFGLPCCQSAFSLRRDVYSGESLDALSPLLLGSSFAEVHLAAGTTLRIRISGPIDPVTEEPRVASFGFYIAAELTPFSLSPAGGGSPSVSPPAEPPQTAITKRTFNERSGLARFRFSSTIPGSGFECKLDKGAFKTCASPKVYRHLKPGRHVFRVRAITPLGSVDGSAAVGRFSIATSRHQR